MNRLQTGRAETASDTERIPMREIFEDSVLGRLEWDEEMNWWIGEVELTCGHRIELFVEANRKASSQQSVMVQAREWVRRIRERETEYRSWSASRLVDGRWNKSEVMTDSDIERLLCLASLECSPDGSARVYWDDNDELFYGHGIYTQLDPHGKCLEVRMQ